jgi:hypothetical protein
MEEKYEDFIKRSITETFKTPQQSTTLYTLDEILSVFRGDYYIRNYFEKELVDLGYKRFLVPGPFKGRKIEKYMVELKKPFTEPIRIKDL